MADASPTAEAAPAPDSAPEVDQLADAGKKALDEERKARREAEKALKEQARELEALRQQSMSDQEKAVAQARDEGRAEALTLAGARLAAAEIRAAAAGRLTAEQIAALTEGLNFAAFIDETGEVDQEKVQRFVDGIAPAVEEQEPQPDPIAAAFPDLGQGSRSTGGDMALNGDPLLNAVRDRLGITKR